MSLLILVMVWFGRLGVRKFVFLLFILFFATKIISSSELANKWFEIDNSTYCSCSVKVKIANSRLSIWFDDFLYLLFHLNP